MKTPRKLSSLLSLTALFATPALSGCDTVEQDGEIIEVDSDDAVGFRNGSGVTSTKWRIRNATAQQNSGQWVFREIDFCADAECTQELTGTAFDSGGSKNWSAPANAFDDDTSTMWKTFDTDVAGQSYIGLEFDTPTALGGLRLQTDNTVYSVDAIYVEYYDADSDSWVIADYLGSVPASTTVETDVEVRDHFPTKWRIRNAVAQQNSGQIALREMDFCADADCAEVLSTGTAFDSGDSKSWSGPERAFDDNNSTMWKTFDADVAGQSYIGKDFGDITDVAGLFLKTDNVVYSVNAMYVEYYDVIDDEWVIADYLGNLPHGTELTRDVEVRDHFPTRWRVRNAVAQQNSGQIVLREMDFCVDSDCAEPHSGGTAFDSGGSKSWSGPENAFDNNTSTMWKTFDADVAGQSFLGVNYGDIRDVAGIYLKTDNTVYSVDAMYVEYYDIIDGEWVIADYLGNLPAGSHVNEEVSIRDRFPIQWRVRNAVAQTNSGQIVLREMDFCADAECAEPLTSGTAFDSGASKSWSGPENAFDDDTSTMWKTFDADVAGQSILGMDYGVVTEVAGIYLKTDNVVYSVDSMHVEYFDAIAQEWITHETLEGLGASSEITRELSE